MKPTTPKEDKAKAYDQRHNRITRPKGGKTCEFTLFTFNGPHVVFLTQCWGIYLYPFAPPKRIGLNNKVKEHKNKDKRII